jgi:phospholipid transport system substrate-binding protein
MRAILLCLLAVFLAAAPAAAQTDAAETFVSQQIRSGLSILNDTNLSAEARAAQFEDFLKGTTDLRRIALFTLGAAARTATPAQQDAFVAAFNAYATAVYSSYFQRYNGQSLTVTGSKANAPGDTIVHTSLTDPNGGAPMRVDFRVRTDGPKPVVIDIGIAGVWLALTQRDDFAAWLARNGGGIDALTAHLGGVARSYR